MKTVTFAEDIETCKDSGLMINVSLQLDDTEMFTSDDALVIDEGNNQKSSAEGLQSVRSHHLKIW